MSAQPIAEIRDALAGRRLVPYLGAGMLQLMPDCPAPATEEALAAFITAKVPVPFRIRNRLTAAAQFVENFKHRKTLVALMRQAFGLSAPPSALHRYLVAGAPPLLVDVWYDDTVQRALDDSARWGQVQGMAEAEHAGSWYGWYDARGRQIGAAEADGWSTLLYKPLGGVSPAGNFIVSDSDFVEVMTEIDIQTPIPSRVKALRSERHFLFLGCRFNNQVQRCFARQIMKRSSSRHWAVLPEEPTRNERRFLEEQGIERIAMPLEEFAELLMR